MLVDSNIPARAKPGKILTDIMDLEPALTQSRRAFTAFIERCRSSDVEYRLTPAADESAYARCFGIYCRHLAGDPIPPQERAALSAAVRNAVRGLRTHGGDLRRKGYRQLLAFSLSALSALGSLSDDPLDDLVTEQIPSNVKETLHHYGCFAGRPGSGNQAMFTAVFLLHSRDHLGMDTAEHIEHWVTSHIRAMNRFGFWGPDWSMTHLQFQNGYHQHEILEYLGASNPRADESIAAVRSLADPEGHFAPYPGGGGCYDYDAVFVLTPNGTIPDEETRAVLRRTAETLLGEQQGDGGFAESLQIRPRDIEKIGRMVAHVARGGRNALLVAERLRFALALQRPKHSHIRTHWSRYSRRWNESDLWDSWFRMMTVARIQSALVPAAAPNWGFLDAPGIGYHPSARVGRLMAQ
jgi:hypothetical protein